MRVRIGQFFKDHVKPKVMHGLNSRKANKREVIILECREIDINDLAGVGRCCGSEREAHDGTVLDNPEVLFRVEDVLYVKTDICRI